MTKTSNTKTERKTYLHASIKLLLAFTLVTQSIASAFAGYRVTYYHNDVLGSPIAATDEAGNIKWRQQYQPFGKELNLDPRAQQETVVSYTGHAHDEDSGLVYMGARYYDPEIGRFMGMDPQGFTPGNPISFNPYLYANNNPYSYVDPDGNIAIIVPIIWAISAISAGATGYEVGTAINDVATGKADAADLAGEYGKDLAVDLALKAVPGGVFVSVGKKLGVDEFIAKATKVPDRIYRQGRSNDSAIKDIRVDADGTSFRDSLSNSLPADGPAVLKPGKQYIGVDTTKLPPGSVVVDNIPPGHVSVKATAEEIVQAIDKASSGKFPRN